MKQLLVVIAWLAAILANAQAQAQEVADLAGDKEVVLDTIAQINGL